MPKPKAKIVQLPDGTYDIEVQGASSEKLKIPANTRTSPVDPLGVTRSASGKADIPAFLPPAAKAADIGISTLETGIPLGAGIAAGMAGGPLAGAVAEAGTSFITDYLAQELRQRFLEGSEPSIAHAAGVGALNVGTSGISMALPGIKGKIVRSADPVVREAWENLAKRYPNLFKKLQPTLGQVTGSRGTQTAENVAQGTLLRKIEQQQFNILSSEGAPRVFSDISQGNYGVATSQMYKNFQKVLHSNWDRAKSEVSNAYKIPQAFADNHTMTIRKVVGEEPAKIIRPGESVPRMIPQIEETVIAGPIETSNARIFARKLKDDLDAFITGDEFTALPPTFQGQLTKAKAAVDSLLEGTKYEAADGTIKTMHVLEYKTAKEFATALRNASWVENAFSDRAKGAMSYLSHQLKGDIKESMAIMWKNGTAARAAYERADTLNTALHRKFPKQVQKFGGLSGTDDIITGDDFVEFAFKDPERLQKFMDVTPGSKPELQGEYLSQLFYDSIDPANQTFKPDEAIKRFSGIRKGTVEDTLFSPEQQKTINSLLRVMKKVSETKQAGEVAFKMREYSFAIQLAARALSSPVTTGAALVGAGGGISVLTGSLAGLAIPAFGLTAMFGAKQFTKRVLMDPRNARIVTRLAKMKPYSPEAIAHSKNLLIALKGLPIMLEWPNGLKVQATINQQGKPEISPEDRELLEKYYGQQSTAPQLPFSQ